MNRKTKLIIAIIAVWVFGIWVINSVDEHNNAEFRAAQEAVKTSRELSRITQKWMYGEPKKP